METEIALRQTILERESALSRERAVLDGTAFSVIATSTEGVIEFFNAGAERMLGYAAEELIGRAHNIIRHPDMPAAAFRDMWATIGRGRPWSGIVKNRRKNGDHYWVQANAMPIMASTSAAISTNISLTCSAT